MKFGDLQSQKAYFGETLSEEAKKVLGYLVAKNILSFLCEHEDDFFDTFFFFFPPPLNVDNHICCFTEGVVNLCHLNKTFHCGAEGLVALVFVDALL